MKQIKRLEKALDDASHRLLSPERQTLGRVAQVKLNLLLNALEALPDGAPGTLLYLSTMIAAGAVTSRRG